MQSEAEYTTAYRFGCGLRPREVSAASAIGLRTLNAEFAKTQSSVATLGRNQSPLSRAPSPRLQTRVFAGEGWGEGEIGGHYSGPSPRPSPRWKAIRMEGNSRGEHNAQTLTVCSTKSAHRYDQNA